MNLTYNESICFIYSKPFGKVTLNWSNLNVQTKWLKHLESFGIEVLGCTTPPPPPPYTIHPRIRFLKIGGLGFLFLIFDFFACQYFLILVWSPKFIKDATCLTILLVHQNKLNKYDACIKKNKHILCRYSLRVGQNLVDLNEQRIR